MSTGKTALVVIDAQQEYFAPLGKVVLPDAPAAVKQIARALAWARAAKVPVNEPGRCFVITGSPATGRASGWISSAGLPGAKVDGLGRRLSWTTCTTGVPELRAHARARASCFTADGPSGRTTFPIGAKYSCWASMTTRALVGDAMTISFRGAASARRPQASARESRAGARLW